MTLGQENFDVYLDYRSGTDVRLSTLVDEMKMIVSIVRAFPLKLGASFVPQVEVQVPEERQSKRFDIFTEKEWKRLNVVLDQKAEPESGRFYVRDLEE